MDMVVVRRREERMRRNAGIAIGPILFIIAILAILAAAIAAGSGSFSQGTHHENYRAKSIALVQIGENLRIGMDVMVLENAYEPENVDIDVTHTSTNAQLFSPIGGGIAPPSVGMANDPLLDVWYFPQALINGIGTGTDPNILAVLPVAAGVCEEINNRSVGQQAAPAAKDLGDFTAAAVVDDSTAGTWPTTPPLTGVQVGCVRNSGVTLGCTGANADGTGTGCTSSPTSPYFFYQVLAIQ